MIYHRCKSLNYNERYVRKVRIIVISLKISREKVEYYALISLSKCHHVKEVDSYVVLSLDSRDAVPIILFIMNYL